MVSTLALFYKIAFLRIKPEAADAIWPDGPILSTPLVHLVTAEIMRDIGTLILDPKSKDSINNISKKLLSNSFEEITSRWDSSDDLVDWKNKWFNPWPKWLEVLGPQPEPWITDNNDGPRPEPWLEGSATEQIVLGNLVMSMTEIPDLEEYSNDLEEIATAIIQSSANNLLEEFFVNNRQTIDI